MRSASVSGLPRRRPLLWFIAGSLVSVLAATVFLWQPRREARPLRSEPQTAGIPDPAASAPPERQTPDMSNPPVLRPTVIVTDTPRDAYSDLALKAAGALGEVTAYVMPAAPPHRMSPPEVESGTTGGWIDGVKNRLKPIGRSLDDAFDFLWEAGQSAEESKT